LKIRFPERVVTPMAATVGLSMKGWSLRTTPLASRRAPPRRSNPPRARRCSAPGLQLRVDAFECGALGERAQGARVSLVAHEQHGRHGSRGEHHHCEGGAGVLELEAGGSHVCGRRGLRTARGGDPLCFRDSY